LDKLRLVPSEVEGRVFEHRSAVKKDFIVADTGVFRLGHQVWQRANITAAAAYLREVLAREPDNSRVKALYDGLLDVMEPTRRVLRQQRELATVAGIARQRRATERRAARERRLVNLGPPEGSERRAGKERRSGKDRRTP
jgi:hypothetical protein